MDDVNRAESHDRGPNGSNEAGQLGRTRLDARVAAGAQPRAALILEEDPDLGENLSAVDYESARRILRAEVIEISAARWEPPALDPRSSFGFLVLDGLLGRRLSLGRAISTELLSGGDILRPWDEPDLYTLVPPEVSWRVYQPSRVAVLDERLTRIVGRRPQLIVNFSGRLLLRARHATYMGAVSHLVRVEDRLLLTLWHMASQWGAATPQGFRVPFQLTHQVFGEIIGARRPSVSVSMGKLQRRGQVVRDDDDCYVLTGDVERVMSQLSANLVQDQ
jgi:CRP-like cAMP-binding protein